MAPKKEKTEKTSAEAGTRRTEKFHVPMMELIAARLRPRSGLLEYAVPNSNAAQT